MSTNTLRGRSPIKVTVPTGLLDLREQVLARSTKRMPKWKFRLAPDAVMMLQPKIGKQGRVATKNGDAWEWIDFPRQFEGKLLICEGADADKLLKHPFGMLYCQQEFAISTDDAGGHRIVGTGFSANTGLKDQTEREARWNELDRQSTDTLLAALGNGTFDSIGPAMMLTPNCLMCGKSLTDPASMARGIGPECAGTGSVHVPRMQNLAGGEDEVAPVPRRPFKLVLLKEAPEPEPDFTPPTIVRSVEDVTIVPTPVTYRSGSKVWTEEEPRARLFQGREKATVILGNIYSEPFIEHCKLTLVEVSGAKGRMPSDPSAPWRVHIHMVRAGKQQRILFDREFPADSVLIAWGWYEIDLTGLPPRINFSAPTRWWCPSYMPLWEEVSRRLHAVAKHTVWLDTTEAACAARRVAIPYRPHVPGAEDRGAARERHGRHLRPAT